MKLKKSCEWATHDSLYLRYHDEEWAVPAYEDQRLFEMLILEGAQAGLSWITILKKRENYRQAFDGFNAEKMAVYGKRKVNALLKDTGIVRNRLKIASAIQNAKAFLEIKSVYDSFSDYIWQFVEGTPLINRCKSMQQIPTSTVQSVMMSKDLKRRGFNFVGPTICYAYMQSVGMVNDHLMDCFRYEEIQCIQGKQQK